MTRFTYLSLFFCILLAACQTNPGAAFESPYPLASSSQYRVSVEVALAWDETGQTWLEATFIPEEGYHLYAKDIPRTGIGGLGRPTLLELVPDSRLASAGLLSESIASRPDENVEGLFVYPPGPVTLRLPVFLPEGAGWYDESISITYMACKSGVCSTPVAGKIIQVRIPGSDEVKP